MVDNLGMNGKNMKFLSSYTIYEKSDGVVVVITITGMNPTSNHIVVEYHWLRNHTGEEFVIQNIEHENQKADIFAKVFNGVFFLSISKLLCSWKAFRLEGAWQ